MKPPALNVGGFCERGGGRGRGFRRLRVCKGRAPCKLGRLEYRKEGHPEGLCGCELLAHHVTEGHAARNGERRDVHRVVGARIERARAVADGIEAFDGRSLGAQDLGVGIDLEAGGESGNLVLFVESVIRRLVDGLHELGRLAEIDVAFAGAQLVVALYGRDRGVDRQPPSPRRAPRAASGPWSRGWKSRHGRAGRGRCCCAR